MRAVEDLSLVILTKIVRRIIVRYSRVVRTNADVTTYWANASTSTASWREWYAKRELVCYARIGTHARTAPLYTRRQSVADRVYSQQDFFLKHGCRCIAPLAYGSRGWGARLYIRTVFFATLQFGVVNTRCGARKRSSHPSAIQ